MLGVAVRERFQQHAVHDGKHGGRRADRQREREDDGDGIGPIVPQATKGVSNIEPQGAHENLDGASACSVDAKMGATCGFCRALKARSV